MKAKGNDAPPHPIPKAGVPPNKAVRSDLLDLLPEPVALNGFFFFPLPGRPRADTSTDQDQHTTGTP